MPLGNRIKYFRGFFQVCILSQFKKYHPSGNVKFNYLGIPKLKIAYFNGILPLGKREI